jgi:molecular chaperone DnaK
MSTNANNIIGIDLGTTTTLVARFNDAGRPEILPNRAGQDITPSVVQILDNGDIIVGDEAKKLVGTGTPNVFAEFKREIGTDKTWDVNGRTITPTDLSALLLKQVVQECAEQFGKPSAIVVSWPANFREEQRQATMDAAKRAGLDVQFFISEPNAAALYYTTDTQLDGKYLIYDFGGGTFDVTVLEARGGNIDVIFTGGVQQLGGKDLDAELMKIIANKFKAKTGGDFDVIDCTFGKANIEEAKHSLSIRDKTAVRVVSGIHGPVALDITREEFEAAISHIVTQAEIACEGVLMQANLNKADIREIFMAGGTSRVPAMQKSVERLFSQKPLVKNPDKAIALGASVYASLKIKPKDLTPLQAEATKSTKLTDIAPHYFGTTILDMGRELKNDTIIAKGTKLPCKVTKSYSTVSDGQENVNCDVTQSGIEESNIEFVSKIWEGKLPLKNPGPSGREIQVTYAYDINGTMKCSFKDMQTGDSKDVDLQAS